MEFFRQTNIDFLKYKWWAIGASWALIALGVFTVFVAAVTYIGARVFLNWLTRWAE